MFYESLFPLIVRNWTGLKVCFGFVAARTRTKNFILGINKLRWKLMEIVTAVYAVEQTAIIQCIPTPGITKMNGRRLFNPLPGFKGIVTLICLLARI